MLFRSYYRASTNVPAGTDITNTTYWTQYTPGTQDELMTTRLKDQAIDDAILTQADVEVPASGYDVKSYYIVPTVQGVPVTPAIWNLWDRDTAYKAGTVVNIDRQYWTARVDVPPGVQISNQEYWTPYQATAGGQPASPDTLYTNSATTVDGTQGGMNVTPQGDGYTVGYLTGDGVPPNGLPCGVGTTFPSGAVPGDYFLRLDYFPNRLFRYNGSRWLRIEDKVRTNLNNGSVNDTLRSSFVNNTYTTATTDQGNIPSRQSLSEVLRPRADNGSQGGHFPAKPYPNTQPGQKSS